MSSNNSSPHQQQQLEQEPVNVHRASFVEELLKQQQHQQSQTPPAMMSPANDNLRRNSLLSVLQGRSSVNQSPSSTAATVATTPMMNSIDAFLQSQSQPYYQEQ